MFRAGTENMALSMEVFWRVVCIVDKTMTRVYRSVVADSAPDGGGGG